MLEILINTRRTLNLKQALLDAVDDGEYESLLSDIRDSFTDEQIEEIEELLDSGDIEEVIDDIITDWNGDDIQELFSLLSTAFSEFGIGLQFDQDELDFDETDETEVLNDMDMDESDDGLDFENENDEELSTEDL